MYRFRSYVLNVVCTVSHLTWNPRGQHAAVAASELQGNELVAMQNIDVACLYVGFELMWNSVYRHTYHTIHILEARLLTLKYIAGSRCTPHIALHLYFAAFISWNAVIPRKDESVTLKCAVVCFDSTKSLVCKYIGVPLEPLKLLCSVFCQSSMH
jgi:hypothetical protein